MIEELTQKVIENVQKHEPFGFNVRFDLTEGASIYVSGDSSPISVSNDSNPADTVFIAVSYTHLTLPTKA